jgi:Flp pilus assembly protein TadG
MVWFALLRLRSPGSGVIQTSRRVAACRAGTATIEFAFVSSILVIMLLNMVDFSLRIWSQMEVDNVAEVGAQAAYANCAGITVPSTTNCPSMTTAITTAIQSSSLGNRVSLASGSPVETYYCLNGTALQSVGSGSSPPSPYDCSAAGNAAATPGDYITVNVNYTFTPLFPGLSIVSSGTLSGTGMMRLK